MPDTKNLGSNSMLIHGGKHEDKYKSAAAPIYQASTFCFDTIDYNAACCAGSIRSQRPVQKYLRKEKQALQDGLICLSIGIEDIITNLEH